MQITKEAIRQAQLSQRCRNRLALEMDVSSRTVDRWLEKNDESLTIDKAVQIIHEETGIPKNEIRCEEEVL